jgi:hypothetical protein
MSSSSLAVTVSRAVAFLTRPLSSIQSPAVVNKLQLVLEANLVAAFAPTWDHMQPLRGSGRRCLTLSPHAVPPRPIHNACVAAGIQWVDWISLISQREFDFFVDPGCVSYRVGQKGEPGCQTVTVWADEVPSPVVPLMDASRIRSQLNSGLGQKKTLSQHLSELDQEDDEEIFAMINEACDPQQWLAPIDTRFPSTKRSTSPLSTISNHSRSSSSSSVSGYSADSRWTSSSSSSPPQLSRRDRARQARVYVDTTKKEVTPYDGGKTTVLTGGVMLGGGASSASPMHHGRTSSMNWRNTGY